MNEAPEYWDAAARGELLLKRCVDSGRCFHYPREHSPFSGGSTEWVRACGTGVIYPCSVNYRTRPHYCIPYVQLDEGPIILTNVEHEDLASIAIGQRVRVVFRPDATGRATPFFAPSVVSNI